MSIKYYEEKLKLANDAYAKGVPFLTDYEYDQLWQALRKVDPNNRHLYHTAKGNIHLNVVPHMLPMLSLDKAFDTSELKLFLHRFYERGLIVQPKYDGIAVCLYQMPDGSMRLIKAGDGLVGEEITRHLGFISDLPAFAGPFCQCEAIITYANWSPDYGKNPRNTVAGLLNRRSLEGNEIPITLIPHACLDIDVPPDLSQTDLHLFLMQTYEYWNHLYPMDGLVLKVKDTNLRLKAGSAGIISKWAIAWKPPIQTAETTVTKIEWNVSKTGRIIPTVIYEPVELCHTTNSRATGNNAVWISARGIGPGAKILVGKAGEIIPEILSCIEAATVPLPDNCPLCKTQLEYLSVHLVCQNVSCKAKLISQLVYMCSKDCLKIPHVGVKAIESLLEFQEAYEILKDSPWAFLEPDNFGLVDYCRNVWGEGYANTYFEAVLSITEVCPAKFMAGLGFKDLGYKNALMLLQIVKGDRKKAPSWLAKAALYQFPQALKRLNQAKSELKRVKIKEVPQVAHTSFCITGTLSYTRDEVIARMAYRGWQYKGSISKDLNYLVVGELEHETTKLKKAKQLGIKMIKEKDLNLEEFQLAKRREYHGLTAKEGHVKFGRK